MSALGVIGQRQADFVRHCRPVHFDDFVGLGMFAKAREASKLRIEGKDYYVVKDGDVMEFRFHV